jgi:phasin family protein
MVSKARKLINEQAQFAGEQARIFTQAPGRLVRRAAEKSAARIKALQRPARAVTRSGVRLASLSQHTVESLLELQLEVLTSALTNAAEQLERVARASSVRALVGGQADELKAARARIVKDIQRVLEILKRAGKGVRSVATDTYSEVVKAPKAAPAARRPTRKSKSKSNSKAKRVARKAKRKVTKTARRARR